MKFLLRLKHWQLFILTWGIPIAINLVTITDPFLMIKFFPVMLAFLTLGIFGWIWATATELHKKLPADVKLAINTFKIIFLIPAIYILFLIGWIGLIFYSPENSFDIGNFKWLLFILHLGSMVCIVLSIRTAAKTFRSVELSRPATFSDYATEFVLIWFSPIGLWILQPRLNKLVDQK